MSSGVIYNTDSRRTDSEVKITDSQRTDSEVKITDFRGTDTEVNITDFRRSDSEMVVTIRGAIFDLDGVILDSLPIWEDLGARYLIRHGIRPEDGLNEILFSMSMEQGAQYLKAHYPLNQSEEEILTGIEAMIESFYVHEVPAKLGSADVLELLRRRGIRMVAATSSPRGHVTQALGRLGLLLYFEEIFTTSEVGKSKHDPLIYQLAAQALGTAPKETYVFEDSLYALRTAKAAGFRTVGVRDEHGESDQEGMRAEAEIYLDDMRSFYM